LKCYGSARNARRRCFFRLTDLEMEGYNKFIPYYLHPECTYSVGLSRSNFRNKVSVGSNPWTKRDDLVNLAKICERYAEVGTRALAQSHLTCRRARKRAKRRERS